MDRVYQQAVEASRAGKAARAALQQTPDQLAERLHRVHATLFAEIVDAAPGKIMAAAARGMTTADVYNFNGNDHVDDISVLFVLCGARPHAPPAPPGAPDPLLHDLRAAFAPFEIAHDWDGISNGNRIVARWTV